MAKLSARGRHCLAAVIKRWDNPTTPREATIDTDFSVEYEWQITKRRFMSDGTVLQWCKWKHYRHTEPFTTGWKVLRKYPVTEVQDWLKKKIELGWTQEN